MKISYNWLQNILIIFTLLFAPMFNANALCTRDFSSIVTPYLIITLVVVLFLLRSIYRYIKKKSSLRSVKKMIIILIIVVIAGIYFINNVDGIRIDNYITSVKCDLLDGNITNICDTLSCEKPSTDFGTPCRDNSECEKYCEIYNPEEIVNNWNEYSYKGDLNINEWTKRTNIIVDSRCSKFNRSTECNSIFFKGLIIEDGFFKKVFQCNVINY